MIDKILKSKHPFEEYLREVHAEDYIGLDDEMSDDFDNWIGELDPEELISYGNVFSKLLIDSFFDLTEAPEIPQMKGTREALDNI